MTEPIELDPREPVRTWSLADAVAGTVATFVSEPDGGGYLAVTHGNPDDPSAPFVRLRVEFGDDDYAELVRQVAGPAAQRLRREEEATEAYAQARRREQAERDRVRAFVVYTSEGNRNGSTRTVHLKGCATRHGTRAHNSDEVTESLEDRWAVIRRALEQGGSVAVPSSVQGGNWLPLKFCERCRPLGAATPEFNRRVNGMAYVSARGRTVADLEQLRREVETLLWEFERGWLREQGLEP